MPSSARVSAGGICSFLVGRSVNAPRDDVGIVPYDRDGCLFSVEIDAFYFACVFVMLKIPQEVNFLWKKFIFPSADPGSR